MSAPVGLDPGPLLQLVPGSSREQAEACGVTQRTVWRWRSGCTGVDRRIADAVAVRLGRHPAERDQRFTAQDFLALTSSDRNLVRGWLHVHDIEPRNVVEVVLWSPHMASVVCMSRPLRVGADGELVTDTFTFQVRVPFPVEAGS